MTKYSFPATKDPFLMTGSYLLTTKGSFLITERYLPVLEEIF